MGSVHVPFINPLRDAHDAPCVFSRMPPCFIRLWFATTDALHTWFDMHTHTRFFKSYLDTIAYLNMMLNNGVASLARQYGGNGYFYPGISGTYGIPSSFYGSWQGLK